MYQYGQQESGDDFQPGDNQNSIYTEPNNKGEKILFIKDSVEFFDENEKKKFRKFLKEKITRLSVVYIDGFASNEGSKDYNFKLSLKRAQKIKSLIAERHPYIKVILVPNGEVEGDKKENRSVVLNVVQLTVPYKKTPDRNGNWYLCEQTNELEWKNRDGTFWDEKLYPTLEHFTDQKPLIKRWERIGKTLDESNAAGGIFAQMMLKIFKKSVTTGGPKIMGGVFEDVGTTIFPRQKKKDPPKDPGPVYTEEMINKEGVYLPYILNGRAQDRKGDNYDNLYLPISHETVYDKVTHDTGMFYIRDDFPADNFFYLTLSSWIYGIGYENYFFGPDSLVSKQLAQSSFIQRAVERWKGDKKHSHNIDNGPTNPMNVFNEFIKDGIIKNSTYKTVSHTIGGANIIYTFNEKTKILKMEVINVMNVGSGTGANANDKLNGITKSVAEYILSEEEEKKELGNSNPDVFYLGRNAGYPRVQNLNIPQPYTNISQTIIVEKKIE